MIFFPSYRFMEEILDQFHAIVTAVDGIHCIAQSQSMGEDAREKFLENFEGERVDSLIGFCVMGGIFSEGIDLTKDRLIGAIVIGTGIPQVCYEREILKNYFDKKARMGFDYAYLYPGINKVLQSAGRVIRTEEDKGIILLLDERFLDKRYLNILPREWENIQICTLRNVGTMLEEFWNAEMK